MTSISPRPGRADRPMSWPSIQKAGQIPRARGIFSRLFQPVPQRHRSLLIGRAEVSRHARYRSGPVPGLPADHDGRVPGPVEGGLTRLICVILQFLVSPPGSADLGLPGPAVHRGPRGAIELIDLASDRTYRQSGRPRPPEPSAPRPARPVRHATLTALAPIHSSAMPDIPNAARETFAARISLNNYSRSRSTMRVSDLDCQAVGS